MCLRIWTRYNPILEKIFEKIETLSEEPRQFGYKKLKNPKQFSAKYKFLYRVKVGDYRIVYAIEDFIITITVIGIGHRREIYE